MFFFFDPLFFSNPPSPFSYKFWLAIPKTNYWGACFLLLCGVFQPPEMEWFGNLQVGDFWGESNQAHAWILSLLMIVLVSHLWPPRLWVGWGKAWIAWTIFWPPFPFFFFFSNCTSNWLRLALSCMTICQTIRAEGFWPTFFSFAHQCPSGKVIPDRCGNTWNVKRAGLGVSERTRQWLKF